MKVTWVRVANGIWIEYVAVTETVTVLPMTFSEDQVVLTVELLGDAQRYLWAMLLIVAAVHGDRLVELWTAA